MRHRRDHANNLLIVRFSLALVFIFGLLGAAPGRAEDVLPPRFNFDRYARMAEHSLFAIATAVAVPSVTPDFAKDLYVANAARSSESDMVTIASSSDQNFKKYLTTREPVDGFSIASIEWSSRVGATKVTISKDEKFVTLTFNQALLSEAASARPPAPGQVFQNVPLIPPPGAVQGLGAHSRGMIQRNPEAVGADASTPNPEPAATPDLAPPAAPPAMSLPTSNVVPNIAPPLPDESNTGHQRRMKQPGEPD